MGLKRKSSLNLIGLNLTFICVCVRGLTIKYGHTQYFMLGVRMTPLTRKREDRSMYPPN